MMIPTLTQSDGLTYLIVQFGALLLVLAFWWQVVKPHRGMHE
jgi:hypothetical protein